MEDVLDKEQDCMTGYKVAMERVLQLFCSNVTGDVKSKPVAIYQLSQPRALKNVSLHTLPVIWKANKTAWMTIFEDWFLNHFCPLVEKY